MFKVNPVDVSDPSLRENCATPHTVYFCQESMSLISALLRRRPLMYLVQGHTVPLLFPPLLFCHDICELCEKFRNLRHYPFIPQFDGLLVFPYCFSFLYVPSEGSEEEFGITYGNVIFCYGNLNVSSDHLNLF